MPSYPPPQLNDRQLMLAQLLALEKSPQEVADIVGVPIEYVRLMKKSSLFLTKVKDERDKYLDGLRMAAREKIVREADKSVDTLVRLRDYSEDEKVVLAASNKLIDQAELLDKKMKVSEERRVSVTISPEKTKLVQAIISEGDDEPTRDE